jgi:hypothetical protein
VRRRQGDPAAAIRALRRRKGFEEPRQHFRRDAAAGVGDAQRDLRIREDLVGDPQTARHIGGLSGHASRALISRLTSTCSIGTAAPSTMGAGSPSATSAASDSACRGCFTSCASPLPISPSEARRMAAMARASARRSWVTSSV